MSFEQASQENHNEEHESGYEMTPVEVRDAIASELIANTCDNLDDDACIDKWWEDNAEVFLEAFNEAIEGYPNIAEFWTKDHDRALNFFNGRLDKRNKAV